VHYAEFRPPQELRGFVACTWERAVSAGEPRPASRVLPDGCVDLVFRGGELIIAGPDRGPLVSVLAPAETVVGLRLRPGVAGRVLGFPASELRDLRPAIDELWGPAGRRLGERVAEAETPERRRAVLEAAVASRLPDLEPPDPLVDAAIGMLSRPGTRVAELAVELAIGERQLLRRFDAAVGYGPKLVDRVLRFQRFLALAPAIAARAEDLARVAADLGYADQAHLTRDVKALSGLSPSRLAQSRAAFQAL
jgi:AraC-like DNA-binding protein